VSDRVPLAFTTTRRHAGLHDAGLRGARPPWGAQRATLVIDADGKVADVIPKVSPKTHDEQVLKILGDL
jgi:peroxiredoxin